MSEIYLKRGVSAKKEDVHKAISNLDKGLYPNLFCKVFSDYLAGDESYVNLMSSDGSGTKSVIAYLYWLETGDASIFEGIGQDALVMNLDDMACVGAIDTFLYSSIINRNKKIISGEVVTSIIEGTRKFIESLRDFDINISFTGGETADVGDVVRTISVDGSMVSRMPKKDIIYTNSIAENQLIVGLAGYGKSTYETQYNSGIGSNGLTSTRHDLLSSYYNKFSETYAPEVDSSVQYIGKNKLTDIVYENYSLGQLMLSPTRTFTPILKKIFTTCDKSSIASIIHNTGGGQTKVLHFAQQVKIIKDNLLPIPFIFNFIQSNSQTSWKEMFEVFNMGTRMEFYVNDEETANQIIEISKSFGVDSQIIGRVEASSKAEVILTHQNEQISYTP